MDLGLNNIYRHLSYVFYKINYIFAECHDGEFKCLIHEECIPEMKRCDGTKDCEDNSDEWYECGITQRHWLPLGKI
jgi:hypothetical protein